MMTGCSDMRRWIRVSVESSRSMESEEEEELLLLMVGLTSSMACIPSAQWCSRRIEEEKKKESVGVIFMCESQSMTKKSADKWMDGL